MKALTMHAPWAHAVAHLGKDIENRTWRPPDSVIGTRIAIHAGATDPQGDWRRIDLIVRERQPPDLRPVARSAVVATAVVSGVVDTRPTAPVTALHSDYAAVVTSPWWIGPVGWVLSGVRPLATPVPCKGRLGLWTVPDAVLAAIDGGE